MVTDRFFFFPFSFHMGTIKENHMFVKKKTKVQSFSHLVIFIYLFVYLFLPEFLKG